MFRAILRLIVTAEALIGSALMVLLLLGRTNPMVVANTLTVIGVGILALSIGPSTMITAVRRMGGPMTSGSLREGSSLHGAAHRLRSSGFVERLGLLIRGLLMAGIVIGTGLLIEFSLIG